MKNKTLITALILSAGFAAQASAFDGEYEINQRLTGFSAGLTSAMSPPSERVAFQGEYEINRQLAGHPNIGAKRVKREPAARHTFKSEYDITYGARAGSPSGAASAAASGDEPQARAPFVGEAELNARLTRVEATQATRKQRDEARRYAFEGEAEINWRLTDSGSVAEADGDGGRRHAVTGEYEFNRSLL